MVHSSWTSILSLPVDVVMTAIRFCLRHLAVPVEVLQRLAWNVWLWRRRGQTRRRQEGRVEVGQDGRLFGRGDWRWSKCRPSVVMGQGR